ILDGGEFERPRGRQRDAGALLDLALEPGDAAILDRVLEAGVPAIRAITVVALRGDDGGADRIDLIGRDEANDIGQARERLGIAMAHAEAAADGDVVADQPAVLDDADETEVLREDVDVVGRRNGEAD